MDMMKATGRLAVLRYYQNHYDILRHGDFVYCAVTNAVISLSELSYWNVDRQEAYCSAAVAMSRLDEEAYCSPLTSPCEQGLYFAGLFWGQESMYMNDKISHLCIIDIFL